MRVYAYDKCGTCKKALRWLGDRGIAVEVVSIVEAPPSAETLRRIRDLAGVPTRKLFNTSGQSYRSGDWKARLPTLTDDEALAALAADGKLIKRPLVLGDGVAVVGFSEAEYADRFA